MTTETRETWCVCGSGPDGVWEPCEGKLATEGAAEAWLRANAGDMATRYGYTAFYLDRETNDGYAAAYYDYRGGELVLTNVN